MQKLLGGKIILREDRNIKKQQSCGFIGTPIDKSDYSTGVSSLAVKRFLIFHLYSFLILFKKCIT